MGEASKLVDDGLLRELQEVDRVLYFKAADSCCHPSEAAPALGVTIDDLTTKLGYAGEDLLRILSRFQLLTMATLHQFGRYRVEPSRNNFSTLLRLYEETGRFDLLRELIASLASNQSNRYNLQLERLKARHQTQDLQTLDQCRGRSMSTSLQIFVINLPEDHYRLARFSARCQSLGLQFTVEPGLKPADVWSIAHQFKSLPVSRFDGRESLDSLPEGDLKTLRRSGNKIAQYHVWKQLVEQDIDYALIVEDDAWLDRSIVDFNPVEASSGITFVNDRIVRHCRWPNADTASPVAISDLEDPELDFPCDDADIRAPGSDGYLLDRSAAEKLVNIIDLHGIPAGGTDWFLLKASLNAQRLRSSAFQNRLSYFQSKPPFLDPSALKSQVTSRPLSYHAPFNLFMSTR